MLPLSEICGCIGRWLVTDVSEESINFVFRTLNESYWPVSLPAASCLARTKSGITWRPEIRPERFVYEKNPFLLGMNPDILAVGLL